MVSVTITSWDNHSCLPSNPSGTTFKGSWHLLVRRRTIPSLSSQPNTTDPVSTRPNLRKPFPCVLNIKTLSFLEPKGWTSDRCLTDLSSSNLVFFLAKERTSSISFSWTDFLRGHKGGCRRILDNLLCLAKSKQQRYSTRTQSTNESEVEPVYSLSSIIANRKRILAKWSNILYQKRNNFIRAYSKNSFMAADCTCSMHPKIYNYKKG